jgi:hypothetical protein
MEAGVAKPGLNCLAEAIGLALPAALHRHPRRVRECHGGLAVLYGNIAPEGAIVKTAGVPEELWHFSGPARVFESQEDAVDGILADQVKAGDVVIIRYEGPKGGPGMQEMLSPTSFLKGKGLGRECALITDEPVLRLDVPDDELAARRERLLEKLGGYRPAHRDRPVSQALRVYAALATPRPPVPSATSASWANAGIRRSPCIRHLRTGLPSRYGTE